MSKLIGGAPGGTPERGARQCTRVKASPASVENPVPGLDADLEDLSEAALCRAVVLAHTLASQSQGTQQGSWQAVAALVSGAARAFPSHAAPEILTWAVALAGQPEAVPPHAGSLVPGTGLVVGAIVPIHDLRGGVVGVLAVLAPAPMPLDMGPVVAERLRDLAALVGTSCPLSADRRLRMSEARARAVIDGALDSIVTITQDGIIQAVNRACEQALGYTAAELIGRNVSILMPDDIARQHDTFLQRYAATGQKRIIGSIRMVPVRRRDGSVFPGELAVSEMEVDGERLFVGILHDVSGRYRAEAELREKVRLLELAEETGQLGYWRLDVAAKSMIWSPEASRLLGFPADGPMPPLRALLERFRPEDRPRLRDVIRQALRHARPCALEVRLLAPGGETRSVVVRCQPVDVAPPVGGSLGTERRSRLLFGVVQDVTDLRRAEAAQRASEQRLSAAIASIPDGFMMLDAEDRVVMFNQRISDLYPELRHLFKVGASYRDILAEALGMGLFPAAVGREEDFMTTRLARAPGQEATYEELLVRDRWIRIAERRMDNGWLVGVRSDVTELHIAQDQALAASRAKSEFLSRMSHELRTPLNAILGFAQLMLANPREPLSAKQAGYVDHILKSGTHLLDLINEVLDLARIESGSITLVLESVNLLYPLQEAVRVVEGMAAQRRITLEVPALAGRLPKVWADTIRVKQVLINLLSNAVKYNRTGGRVTITAFTGKPGFLRLAIADTGVGIPADRLHELFEPFHRLGAETTEVEGTGIGLTITRTLIDQMGGAIGVDSREGEGSVFWFDLPLDPDAAMSPPGCASALPVAAMVGLQPGPVWSRSETPHGSIAPGVGRREGEGAGRAGNRPVVLYVEDNPANADLMRDIAAELGTLDLLTVGSAEDAFDLLARRLPDLIIMDLNLPGVDGLQAVTLLRQDLRTRDIPIIALSANAMQAAQSRAKEAGVDDYLTKPVVIEDLVEAVDRALAKGCGRDGVA